MLVRQGAARTIDVDRRLAVTLALVAGALNTAAYSAVGFFSANMTGNVSLLSGRWAAGDWNGGLQFLSIVAMFIGGATFSTILINAGRRRRFRSVYALSILTEAGFMGILGLLLPEVADAHRLQLLILGLSFLMGFQNAVVTQISDARVRTTHISGMSTDIGIELGILFDVARKVGRPEIVPHVRQNLRLHAETVGAFLLGGIAGVFIYSVVGNKILLIAAIALAAVGLWGVVRAGKR
jgi:uncharacterized membrane protein YoaK (UPF0700 family)